MDQEEKKPFGKKTDLELKDLVDILRLHLGVVLTISILAIVGTLIGHLLYLPVFDAYSRVEVKTESKASLADYMDIASPIKLSGSGNEAAKKYLNYLHSSTFQVAVAQRLKYRKLKQNLLLRDPRSTSMLNGAYWKEIVGILESDKKTKKVRDNLLVSVEDLGHFIGSVTKFYLNGPLIEIRVRTLDAFTSMEIANTVATVFAESTNENDAKGLQNVENLLSKRLEETRGRLKESELALIDFKKKNRVAAVNQRGRAFSVRLNRIEEQIESIKLKVDSNQNQIAFYEKRKKSLYKTSLVGNEQSEDDIQFEIAKSKLDKLRQQKKMMISSGVGSGDWRYLEIEKEIQSTKKVLKRVLDNGKSQTADGQGISLAGIDEKIDKLKRENETHLNKLPSLEKSASSLRGKLVDVPEAEQHQLMLRRKVDLEYATFSTLQKRLNEIEIQRISLDKKVHIDELSSLPSPVKRLGLAIKLVFSLFVGMFFSMLIAFLLEYTDTSIKSKSDLEEFGINFLGEIPCVFGAKKKSEPKGPNQLVCLNNPSSLNSILFDFVRSRLESSRTRSGKSHVTLTVTSSQANEGKSFIASNLAVSLARLGRKTVLVDCDLRCPSIHAYFDAPNDAGLSDLFETEMKFDQILQKKEMPMPDIITTGWAGGDPTVIFSSENFRVFMKHLRSEYEYVILDCPPVCVVPDAAILANLSDSALLVSKYRSTTRRGLAEAQQKIHQISSKQVHGVINLKLETEKIISYYPYVMPSSNAEDPAGPAKSQRTEDFKKKFESNQKDRKRKVG